jgi:hypothetical protein
MLKEKPRKLLIPMEVNWMGQEVASLERRLQRVQLATLLLLTRRFATDLLVRRRLETARLLESSRRPRRPEMLQMARGRQGQIAMGWLLRAVPKSPLKLLRREFAVSRLLEPKVMRQRAGRVP